MSPTDPEPDQHNCPISTSSGFGQNAAGHWLIQDDAGKLEGRFVSFAARYRAVV